MSRANKIYGNVKPSVPTPTATTREGVPVAYEKDWKEKLVSVVMNNTMGDTFYVDSNTLVAEAEALFKQGIAEDPEFVAKAIAFGRNEGFLKLPNIVGLAMLAQANPALFKRAFPQVILTPADLQDFLTILNGQGRGQGGRAVKTAVASFLNTRLSEYWLTKYNGRGRGYCIGDVIATMHPKPKTAKLNEMFKYAMNGTTGRTKVMKGKTVTVEAPNMEMLPQVAALEKLKATSDPKEQVALVEKFRLPHESVTGSVSNMSPALWMALLKSMPLFATLRNLNTMQRNGVLDKNRAIIEPRLTDAKAVHNAKVLPFRFLTALKNTPDIPQWTKDALRISIENSVANLPEIAGKTAICLDTSGSMGMRMSSRNPNQQNNIKYIEMAAVFAYAMFKKADATLIGFDHTARMLPASKLDTVLTQAERVATPGGSTDFEAPLRLLMDKGVKVDNIIFISDMQQNCGVALYNVVAEYRVKFNRNAKLFFVDLSAYNTALAPPRNSGYGDPNAYFIHGWSDAVPKFVANQSRGLAGMVKTIEQYPLGTPEKVAEDAEE
jgi:60 kDa SS-A/Ro ribonucleoprotein